MSRSFTQSISKPEQVLLLKAALFPVHDALACWQLWKKAHHLDQFKATDENLLPRIFDPLDIDSQRLMPMVYRNLEKTDDPLIPHLRGIYRYTWMTNQRFLLKMNQLISALQVVNIDTMALKGIPLSLLYYRDMGVRLMSDVDILVPTTHANEALLVLQEEPLSLKRSEYEYKYRHLLHAIHLFDSNNVDVDLHWNLIQQHAYAGADRPFWASRQVLPLGDNLFTYTLSPTHQLFHNLIHGFGWGTTPAIRWVADSYVIYTDSTVSINWHELLDLSEQYHLRIPVRQALRLLQTDFRLVLPADVGKRLKQLIPDPTEQAYFTILAKRPPNMISELIRYLKSTGWHTNYFNPKSQHYR